MPRIYISHRPEDSSRNEVAIIRERLIAEFGEENILQSTGSNMEVTTNLQRLVQSCDVLLVIIGRYWANMVDEQGNYLLEDPYDPIHVEIDAGLKTTMVVAILMVDDTPIPAKNQLPEVLRPLLDESILEAPDHTQLDRVLNELIPLWEAIPTEDDEADDPIEEAVVEEAIPEPEEPISPERAREVRQANPPYQSPAQRRESEQYAKRPLNLPTRSPFDPYIRSGILFISFACLCSVLIMFTVSLTPTDSSLPTGTSTVPPTVNPTLEFLDNSIDITDRLTINEPNELRFRSDDISFDYLFTYNRGVINIGFHPYKDILLIYEWMKDGNLIWSISTNSDNMSLYDETDFEYSQQAFSDAITASSRDDLNRSKQVEFRIRTDKEILFSSLDYDDRQVIILSDDGVVYLRHMASFRTISVNDLSIEDIGELDSEKVVYDFENNYLMIVTEDNKLDIWQIDDDVEFVGQVILETYDIQQIAIHRNGKYLAIRSHPRVMVYEIDIDD